MTICEQLIHVSGQRFIVFFKSVVLTAPQHFIDCMRFALKGFCSRQCYGVYLSLLAMVYRHIWLLQDTRYYRQHLYYYIYLQPKVGLHLLV